LPLALAVVLSVVRALPVPNRKQRAKIMEIYSPEIVTAQQNLIFLLQNDADNQALIESAQQRLSLLGLTSDQIKDIEQSKKPIMQLSIYSPYSGVIVERGVGGLSPHQRK
jgi:Cu(I)/Ag(I) efflux system membrane fusion protein